MVSSSHNIRTLIGKCNSLCRRKEEETEIIQPSKFFFFFFWLRELDPKAWLGRRSSQEGRRPVTTTQSLWVWGETVCVAPFLGPHGFTGWSRFFWRYYFNSPYSYFKVLKDWHAGLWYAKRLLWEFHTDQHVKSSRQMQLLWSEFCWV